MNAEKITDAELEVLKVLWLSLIHIQMCIRDRREIKKEYADPRRSEIQAEVEEIVIDKTAMIPVSYTHLDVYKRQCLFCSRCL